MRFHLRALVVSYSSPRLVSPSPLPPPRQVLNLPEDALTKEIKLTQDLMDLFITYQIPTDLLSFDEATVEATGGDARARINGVKSHVAAMHEMIGAAKAQEVNRGL